MVMVTIGSNNSVLVKPGGALAPGFTFCYKNTDNITNETREFRGDTVYMTLKRVLPYEAPSQSLR
jgi:hypothetical protein